MRSLGVFQKRGGRRSVVAFGGFCVVDIFSELRVFRLFGFRLGRERVPSCALLTRVKKCQNDPKNIEDPSQPITSDPLTRRGTRWNGPFVLSFLSFICAKCPRTMIGPVLPLDDSLNSHVKHQQLSSRDTLDAQRHILRFPVHRSATKQKNGLARLATLLW